MHEPDLKTIQKEYHGSLRSYIVGFCLCIVLTLCSFGLVIFKLLAGWPLVHALVVLALLQAAVQLHYFLKLGYEEHPRWELLIFCFMFVVLLVIAVGSIWVMNDLDARLMHDMMMEM